MKFNAYAMVILVSGFFLSVQAHARESDTENLRNMAVVAKGGGSFPTMGGGSFGGGLQFEYSIFPLLSLIIPLDYRFLSMGGFSESTNFYAATGGIGGRFYFSELFWKQKTFRGFFLDAQVGFGYAKEDPGQWPVKQPSNRGATFALAGALGYTHAFDFGLIIGGGLNIFGRAFFSPIKQRGLIAHPNPEILAHAGWAF